MTCYQIIDEFFKRMLIAAKRYCDGEDPKYILRRLTRFAVEDVSLAEPGAIVQAIACWDTYERLGSPEGDLAIMQLTAYLATAPKSVGVYKAMHAAFDLAKKTGSLMPPKHILNAPTKLMSEIGYGSGYQYDPETKDGFSAILEISLTALNLELSSGQELRMDFGYLYGNPEGSVTAIRSYWNNKSFTANVTYDIPHESRIEPDRFGIVYIE